MACRGPVRLVVAAALVAVAASAHAAGGERAGGLYGGGQPLPVVASAVDLRVAGPFVEGRIVQRFMNPFDHAIEAVYVFPLPDDAAVSAMSVRTGDRTIVARIEDRAAARRRYEAAVAAGATGALLEAERADVFTQAVTAIPAHGEVAIELRWDGEVAYHARTWQLTVPLVVGPRAVPGTATGKLQPRHRRRSRHRPRARCIAAHAPNAAPGCRPPSRSTSMRRACSPASRCSATTPRS